MRLRLQAVVAALALSLPAVAHSPGVLEPDAPFAVPAPTISRALYGQFKRGDGVFVVKLSFPEAFAFPLEAFVPHRSEWREHRPAYALVGPGVPTPKAEVAGRLPRPLPPGMGAFVDFSDEQPRPVFYESFTRRYFWSSGVTGYALPPGDFEVWVWSPGGTTGKFGMGFGVEEGVDWSEAFKNWSDDAY